MNILKKVLVGLVALEHIYFLILEMFLWTKPIGLSTFGNTLEVAQLSEVLAMQQGLYNGFLAAGLIWGMFHPDRKIGFQVIVFFLLCVIVAGVFGGLTAGTRIIFVQALPAVIALAAVWMARD